MIARIVTVAFGLLAASLAAGAHADDDVLSNTVRLGYYYVTYDTSADDIRGPFVPAGVNLKLKDVYTPYFAYLRRINPHFSLELTAGAPPLTKTVGKGPATVGSVPYNGKVITTARWLAPTLLLEYSFFAESAPLRPFVGFGVNYTRFYSRQSTPAGDAVAGGPTRVDLPVSVGPAVTAGLVYQLTKHFSLHGSISASNVDTTLKANTAGIIRTTHVSFGPRALVLSAGYSF